LKKEEYSQEARKTIEAIEKEYRIDWNDKEALNNLTHLDLINNQITDITILKDLTNLTQLYLSNNQITDITPLKDLKNLTQLHLSSNQITDITPLKDLTSLTTLYLSYNQITDITPLKDLKNLTELVLFNNQITNITPLKDLKNLTNLDLRRNQITDITPLKDLKNLTTLNLNNNQITDITPLKDLIKLKRLNLDNNKIKFFPKELLNLNLVIKLEDDWKDGIILQRNPIEEPPMEIMAQGREAIVEYFASLKEGQEKINELKILIVGHGESGKTSLLKRILGKEFDPKEHQTYGIEIHQKQIKYSDREVKANFWDFGGQKIMHSTHQFFFTERSFYLLVLDGRAEEDAEYWLKHIESFGGDSPIMLVLNKIDQNPSFDVDRKHLRDKYNIKGFYPISCQTNQGVEALMEALSQEILKVDLIEYPFPSKWLKVKKQLEASTQNYINYENFEAVCIKEGISKKSTQDTLMGFLHDLGVALHFKELELLDTFVLNPIWVTEAVYKIINDKEAIANKGGFSATMLQRILHEDKFPHHKFLFIVDVMKKFEVCYQIEKESYLIPSLFDIREPEIAFDTAHALIFQIKYNFLPNSIISKFIVHRHEEIKDNLRWRTGVILEDKELQTQAYIKADLKDKIIHIKVEGRQKREYLSEIRKCFRKIHAKYEKLLLEEFLMHDGLLFDYKELINHEYHKEATLFKGNKRYIVREVLSGIEELKMTQESIVHYHNYYGETTNQHHNGNGDNVGKNKEENNKIQTNFWQNLQVLFKR